MVPPRFPSGTYDLTLRSKQPDGKQATSKQSVAVAIKPGPAERPVVALITPGKPTVVLAAVCAKADGRRSGCGIRRDRARRQVPCERPHTAAAAGGRSARRRLALQHGLAEDRNHHRLPRR